jgi:hypothetical protein
MNSQSKQKARLISPRRKCHTHEKSLLTSRFLGGFVVTFRRLFNQTHPNRLGRDLNSADLAVDQSPDFLNVGFEFSLRDTRSFLSNTAKPFGLTATGYTPAGYRSLTCKMT